MSPEHFFPQEGFRFTTSRIVTLSALILCGLLSFLWLKEREQRFPEIRPGSYSGFIDGFIPNKRIPLYIERIGAQQLALYPVLDTFQPKWVELVDRGNSLGVREGLFPVTYSNQKTQWKFIGWEAEGRVEGKVFDLATDRTGTWTVFPLHKREPSPQSARNWMLIRQQRDRQKINGEALRSQIQGIKAEVKKLSVFLTQGQQLKEGANKKYKEELQALQQLDQQYQKRLKEIEKLRTQVFLAQQLSPTGKLTSLSRETLAREGRWFDEAVHE